jgi:hypothetical protein
MRAVVDGNPIRPLNRLLMREDVHGYAEPDHNSISTNTSAVIPCSTTMSHLGQSTGTTMSAHQLADVQLSNLYLLQAIRLGIAQDRVSTCCKFGLDAAQAEYLGAMSQEDLWSFVAHIGQSTLFPPRQDLLALLKAPAPLQASLAAVHAPRPRQLAPMVPASS